LSWQYSPLRYVRQVQTPTMFIHGELDNDVYITQAEELYMALKRGGVDTLFVRHPREGPRFSQTKTSRGRARAHDRIDPLERTIA